MNLLLFEQNELNGPCLELNGKDRRAKHIVDILGLQVDDTIRVGMVNGKIGSGRILCVEKDVVKMDVTLSTMPIEHRDMTLILALPRPIMLQRILKQATVMGVRRFHFIRSARVQKSYFQSTSLQEEAVRNVLLQGLEQAMDTRMPEVIIHQRFRPFVEDVVPEMKQESRLLAHPDTSSTLPDLYDQDMVDNKFVLAIGPEGGWNDFEVQSFRDQGFACFSFGSRILHVDTAVLVLLSQLMVLQDLRNR
jgi:16S rRNA (uracil1498-N3)-methyltransferase